MAPLWDGCKDFVPLVNTDELTKKKVKTVLEPVGYVMSVKLHQ